MNQEIADRQVVVGDILYRCGGAYAHRSHEFAIVTKITNTRKIRIQLLQKIRGAENGDDTIVTPNINVQMGGNKLLRTNRTYGRGTVEEWWDFYDSTKQYVDHFDRFA